MLFLEGLFSGIDEIMHIRQLVTLPDTNLASSKY